LDVDLEMEMAVADVVERIPMTDIALLLAARSVTDCSAFDLHRLGRLPFAHLAQQDGRPA